ncbi:MAG: hypothetical protein HFH35_06745 [Eubacterium sp.]|nr:hypothetical protein [Eubacterium sp.]
MNKSFAEQWKEILSGTSFPAYQENKELFFQLKLLIQAIRQELKTEPVEDVRRFLRTAGISDKLTDKLVKEIYDTLRIYTTVSYLRDLEKENEKALKLLLLSIYQNYIVRFERGYLQNLPNQNYDTELMSDIIDEIQSLTDFYVSRRFTLQETIRDLADETGLSLETCTYWAGIIEQNLTELKMNYIMSELTRINRKLSETSKDTP